MDSDITYDWQRRWLPVAATTDTFQPPYQLDQTGYVSITQWGPRMTSTLVGYSLNDLTSEHRCVVLLGEPGIGKSREWSSRQTELEGQPQQLFLNLGTISSEEVLRQELHNSVQVEAWRNNNSVLTLWLDSLDEGLLHVAVLQHALLRALRPLPLQRLRLRIICRNAVWPIGFSEALAAALGISKSSNPAAFLTLLLSPLTRAQVAEAAKQRTFDPEQFLAAVAAADAQPLASRPVTLNMLLHLFEQHQPSFGAGGDTSRAGLYQAGCLALCERPDRGRTGPTLTDARRRLVLAGYVAMLTVLSNRRVVLAEPAQAPPTPSELDLYQLGGGQTANWAGHQATIDAASLRDLLQNTGLFTDLGAGRLVWAHQSYAEFLAAWYVNLTNLSPAALRPLFRSAADPAGGLVPALRETAGWLADLQPTFWSELLALDPLALLQSDLHRLGAEQRRLLVQRLLAWFATLAQVPYQRSTFANRLCHPGLAQQLLPVLTDPAAPGPAARLATDLAIACQLTELGPPLVAQALDALAPHLLRRRALYVLEETAQDADRLALRPLRLAIPELDEDNSLCRHLIATLWPTHLAIDELLLLLRKQQQKKSRISGEFSGLFSPSRTDLPVFSAAATLRSLYWFARHLRKRGRFASDETFFSQAMALVWKRGWELFDEPDLLPALVKLYLAAIQCHLGLPVSGSASQRLAFFDELLRHPKRPNFWEVLPNYRVKSGEEIVSLHEWDALQLRLHTRLSAPARAWLTRILVGMLQRSTDFFTNEAFIACLDALFHAATFPSVAAVLAEQHCAYAAEEEEDRNWRLQQTRTDRKNRLDRHFRRCRKLHELLERRRTIRHLLALGPVLEFSKRHELWEIIGTERIKDGTSILHNIVRTAGWARLSAAQQQQAAEIACAVLQAHPTPPAEWYLPFNTITFGATDLHRAFLICQQVRPEFLAAQPPAFWRTWARFLVRLHFNRGAKTSFELVQRAAAAAPDLVDQAVLEEAMGRYAANRDDVFYHVVAWYQALPAAGFPGLLLDALRAGGFAGGAAGHLLTQLLKAGYKPAWDYAAQLLPAQVTPLPDSPQHRLLLAVYRWLLFPDELPQPADVVWWTWWQRLVTEPTTAVALLNGVMHHHTPHDMSQFSRLAEEQLETLIIWLSNTYALTDADANDWSEQTLGGRMASFRAKLAAELASRGSQLAWDILRRLSEAMGEPWWLRYRLDQVRENVRRNTWQPPQPEALAALSRAADRRWLRSAADLQEVVLESLDRFQHDLHGELATAQVLWVPVRDPAHRSRITGQEVREENFFSDRLRQHLRQDLERSNLLIKREVEIRPSHGAGTGQRPDLYVEAFSRNPANEKIDVVTVLIEVKLSRNDEAETGLATQLGGYLADQAYQHGIFLVGWHFGEYDAKPPRRLGRHNLMAHLQAEAANLKPGHSIAAKVLDIRLPGDRGRNSD